MMTDPNIFATINCLRAVRFVGGDAASFLQGQLTANIRALPLGRLARAAYCSPQGRVIASMLIGCGDRGYVAILPASIADAVVARLSRFVLRADVKIIVLPAGGVAAQRQDINTAVTNGDTLEAVPAGWIFNNGDWRLRVTADEREAPATSLPAVDLPWRRSQILCGIPWVGAATSELFIPQHINFELLNGISFKKGCYVGQEIIARLHYLGKIKRRGYVLSGKGTPPSPGEKISVGDVVNAAADGEDNFVAFVSASCAVVANGGEWNGGSLQWRPMPYSLSPL